MIQSVFELGGDPAREVMVPCTEMWIESDKSAGQATKLAVRSGTPGLPSSARTSTTSSGWCTSKTLFSRPLAHQR